MVNEMVSINCIEEQRMKENAFTHYIRDNTRYGRFKDAAREDKLPILYNKTF